MDSELNRQVIAFWSAGHAPRDIARKLGITYDEVDEVVNTHATEVDRANRMRASARRSSASHKKYSDEEISSAIWTVKRFIGSTPTFADYKFVARELGLPSGILIAKRIGWNNALAAAGLEPRSRKREYIRKWSQAECVAAILLVADRIGHLPSLSEYMDTAREIRELPSTGTIRNRFGTWTEAKLVSARAIESRSQSEAS